MAESRSWADINRELLVSIADAADLSLEGYACLRDVCTAWSSAFANTPQFPCLLFLAGGQRPSAFSLPMQRSFELYPAPAPFFNHSASSFSERLQIKRAIGDLRTFCTGIRLIGSSNGYVAFASVYGRSNRGRSGYSSSTVISLLNPLIGEEIELLRRTDDTSSMGKMVFSPNPRPEDYTAVAIWGLNQVAYMSSKEKGWKILDVGTVSDLAYDTEGGDVFTRGAMRVLRIPRGSTPDPQKPIAIEPLMPEHAVSPFESNVFAPPYDAVSSHLFQVWQNTSATVHVRSPSQPGGSFTVAADRIFVLRYDPERRPCWDVVKDLGGCSVFIGRNSPAVVRPEAVPGVRANSVYWIDWLGTPMVCDMATGISTQFILTDGARCGIPDHPGRRNRFWYFPKDNMTSTNKGKKKRRVSGYDRRQLTGQTSNIEDRTAKKLMT
ncbi:hypothetical protein BRADI_5g13202v3 [Brachypodium distachyon]|uniref:KIB1-4 beta-propeller domain-containing protein n=1 Tax=Brachypodium distachyon TaxID=15368 RepID=A0A0Q3KSL0_BRADI|nr:hypothetical protein BRADI_5g13202v3 [Brachypodium distachyon]